jgi:secretion/DNA translocation related TadE-like protein
MPQLVKNESGQISVLILAISLVLLFGTYFAGAVAQVIVEQQRLNTKAESTALAGAQELEFNGAQACDVAKEFSAANYGLIADCVLQPESVHISLTKPISNPFLGLIFPNIYASSRAGIASGN